MNKTNCILLLLVICLCNAHSQSFAHRKFRYDWNDAQKVTFTREQEFWGYPAIILYEETTIDIELSNIKRYQVYQFDDSAAIRNFNLFRVPISMNSRLDHIPSLYRTDTNDFPQLLYEQINFFDARIIRNGEFEKAVLDEVAYTTHELSGNTILPYFIHYFYVRNLQPGDQLEVVISHHYAPGTSRYYLNDLLPKQEAAIVVNTTDLEKIEAFMNEDLSKFDHIERSDDGKTYRVVFRDLQPVDPSIPTDIAILPRIDFIRDKKYRVTNKPFGVQEIDTIRWRDIFHSISRHIDPGEVRTWENYDNQSYKTTQFFDKIKKAAGENSGKVAFMNFLQRYSADRMGYKNDFRYFIHEEHGFPDLGSYLEKDTLREVSRHTFYFNMLDRLDTAWYVAFLMDNRYERLDTGRLGALYPEHLTYVLMDQQQLPHFYYPKTSRYGYYANELPFYLQDQYVYLLPQTLSRKVHENSPGQILYPVYYVPPSDPRLNTKSVQTRIDVSLKEHTSTATSRIRLSGQYSTLLRGYYLYGCTDSTLSPSYYQDPFKNISIHTTHTDSAQKTTPFLHQFTQQAEQWKNVYLKSEGYYLLDLKHLVNIHIEPLDEIYFKASYHHDFVGTEAYTIDLRFDQMVQVDTSVFRYSFEGKSIGLESSFTKITDNEYQWKLQWTIKEPQTGPDELLELQKVMNAIRYFNKLQVKVKPL